MYNIFTVRAYVVVIRISCLQVSPETLLSQTFLNLKWKCNFFCAKDGIIIRQKHIFKIGVLKNFPIFTGKQKLESLFKKFLKFLKSWFNLYMNFISGSTKKLVLEIQGRFLDTLIYVLTQVNYFKTIKQFCYWANTSLNSENILCFNIFG